MSTTKNACGCKPSCKNKSSCSSSSSCSPCDYSSDTSCSYSYSSPSDDCSYSYSSSSQGSCKYSPSYSYSSSSENSCQSSSSYSYAPCQDYCHEAIHIIEAIYNLTDEFLDALDHCCDKPSPKKHCCHHVTHKKCYKSQVKPCKKSCPDRAYWGR